MRVKWFSYWLTQFFKHDKIHACAPTIYAREAFKQFSAALSSSKSCHATQWATYATLMCRISELILSQSKSICPLEVICWLLLKLLKSPTADTTWLVHEKKTFWLNKFEKTSHWLTNFVQMLACAQTMCIREASKSFELQWEAQEVTKPLHHLTTAQSIISIENALSEKSKEDSSSSQLPKDSWACFFKFRHQNVQREKNHSQSLKKIWNVYSFFQMYVTCKMD